MSNYTNDKMISVKGGEFAYGVDHLKWNSILPDWERKRIEIIDKVVVGDFWLGRHLVTFDDYEKFCRETYRTVPSDQNWGRGARPIINVTWFDAIKYCNWLSQQEGLQEAYTDDGKLIVLDNSPITTTITTNSTTTTTTTTSATLNSEGKPTKGKPTKKHNKTIAGQRITHDILANVEGYRLPSDFEWEFSAKGGTQPGMFHYIGGDYMDEVAWYKDNSSASTKPVGLKKPNELGLFDMPGNVYEYCTDGHNDIRWVRGGGWSSRQESMRASYKNGCRVDEAHSYVGFRVTRTKMK